MMMMIFSSYLRFRCLLCIVLVSLLSLILSNPLVSALSATGQRLLVILPSSSQQSLYSTFLSDLTNRGFQITYRHMDQDADDAVALTAFDERRYDHLILLASTVEGQGQEEKETPSAKDLSPQSLVAFVKDGGNILLAYDPSRPRWVQSLAREFDVELAEGGHKLIDHFQYASNARLDRDGDHSTVLLRGAAGRSAGGLLVNKVVFSPETIKATASRPLLVGNASPHRLGSNPLAFPLVGTSATSYTGSGEEIGILGTDEDTSLATAFQTKENSRVTFLGSVDLLADRLLNAKVIKSPSGKTYTSSLNGAFLRDLTSWTFQEHGVLKVEKRSHYRVRESPTDVREAYEEPPEGGSAIMYRIKDTLTYSLDISQHTPTGWEPAPTDLDLQVSLIMIDPFITSWLVPEGSRSPSSQNPSSFDLSPPTSNATTRFSTSFKLPDRLGVYTLQTHWSRPGWSFLKTRDVAPIRAFNHDENPRFLPASWPYALGSFSTILSFLLFVALWILSKEKKGAKEKTL